MRQFKHNPQIKSWLLQSAKQNGYGLHKVTPAHYNFCWLLMEQCDLYTRDFDTQNLVNSSQVPYLDKTSIWPKEGGSKLSFETMHKLLSQTNKNPMLISVDLQDLHHPLPYEERPGINYTEPVISLHDLHLTYSGGLEITPQNKASIVQKLRNRVTNNLLNLDQDIFNVLSKANLDNTLLILTGDHSELLFDTEKNFIWHGVNNPIDLQRQVPLYLYGPKDILTQLQVPENIVTCHSDVLPSIWEALAQRPLGKRWREELDYNSYFSRTKAKGFAYNALHEFQVLIQGNQRVSLYNDAVKEAHYLNDATKELEPEKINPMVTKIRRIEDSTWPGWNKRSNCTTVDHHK